MSTRDYPDFEGHNDTPENVSNLNKPQFSSLQSNSGLEVSDLRLSFFDISSAFFFFNFPTHLCFGNTI